MAWTTSWQPQIITPYTFDRTWNTTTSRFESGKEQRRQKWSASKSGFNLYFNAQAAATLLAIRNHFDSMKGSYTTFTFPNYAEQITDTIALVNSNPDTITDSGSGFSDMGFVAGQTVTVDGSTSDDGEYTIDTGGVVAGTLTLIGTDSLSNESATSGLKVYRTYTVRYDADTFMSEYLTPTIGRSSLIRLIQVI